ncbi:MAG: hypothetical protein QOF89_3595 [Acidobacteriota bacterium]|nr:hypothetical protein [Acidobacteriota bacterium]
MSPAKRSAVRNVFLSSTARDLGPYRDAVYKAISGLDGFHCVRKDGLRVFRGGSCFHDSRNVRCAVRDWHRPNLRNGNIGFRVALSPLSSDL